jgi:hypothetical protein
VRTTAVTPMMTCVTLTAPAFAELGVEEVICSLASVPFALYDESALGLLAETVVPAARKLEPIR